MEQDRSGYHAVSLSGGKDSTAMLLMMVERGMRVDAAVYADTGMDLPAMEAHLARVEELSGVPVVRVRPPLSFEHYLLDHEITRGKRAGGRGYGWPRPRARWCTARLKVEPIARHLRAASAGRPVTQYLGIAADEAPRRRRERRGVRYPLAEWGVTEADALDYCRRRGLDWEGEYRHFNRRSCWCCPLQSLPDLRALRRRHPDLWSLLSRMDERAWNTFRIGCSVADLERRFASEDAQEGPAGGARTGIDARDKEMP